MANMRTMNGGNFFGSCQIDTSKLLGSITTEGGSYTTTQDCGMVCKMSTLGYQAFVCMNGDTSKQLISSNTSQGGISANAKIGFDNNDNLDGYAMFIPKGTTLTTREHTWAAGTYSNTYDVRFYKLI